MRNLASDIEVFFLLTFLFIPLQPTSGLDARSANLIVKTLRKIANGDRTICATIHQPSSAVFEMFVRRPLFATTP